MHFVLGLLIQEIVEAWRQGAFIYFSKWWNVVDTVIILTFIGAYGLWLIAWGVYGEWKPEKKSFHLSRWHLCQCLRRGLFSFGTLFPGQFNAGSLTAVTLQNAERCP